MPKIPRIPSSLVIGALKRARFYIHHQTGSHIQLRHLDNPKLRVTIPFSREDLAPKTIKSIIRQANLTIEEFLELI